MVLHSEYISYRTKSCGCPGHLTKHIPHTNNNSNEICNWVSGVLCGFWKTMASSQQKTGLRWKCTESDITKGGKQIIRAITNIYKEG